MIFGRYISKDYDYVKANTATKNAIKRQFKISE